MDHGQESQDAGDGQDPVHFPAYRPGIEIGVVIGNGHDGDVVQQRQQDDHDGGQGKVVEGEHGRHHEDHDVDGHGDAVNSVTRHALKDAPGFLHRSDDDRQPRFRQDQSRSRPGRVGGPGDCDAHIRLFEGRRVIDSISRHAYQMAQLL